MTMLPDHNTVEMTIIPRASDIGGFEVLRALPFRDKRMVGPFIFWDEMGPGEFLSGQGVDVRPHPHIGLSTVTYLFDGAMDHRDSLGSCQTIVPGDVNLMHAGNGIAHSERTGPAERALPHRLAGVQSWLAQPYDHEESSPSFFHHGKGDLPVLVSDGIHLRLVMGQGQYGLSSPVKTQWDTFYADVTLAAGAQLPVPVDVEERAVYVLSGEVEIGATTYAPHQMLVLAPHKPTVIKAVTPVRLMLLGGAVMDGPRYIWWNFVSSRRDTIKDAAERWHARSFPTVTGDEIDFIPLPGQPRLAPIDGARG